MRRYVVAVTLGSLLAASAGCGDSSKGTTTPKENVAIIPGGPQPGGAGQPAIEQLLLHPAIGVAIGLACLLGAGLDSGPARVRSQALSQT